VAAGPVFGALESSVSNGQFLVVLPESAATNHLRMVEWSENLVDWEPVARDYGHGWENMFPHALEVSAGQGNQVLHDPSLAPQRFHREVTTGTETLGNSNSVSRFLQQATFGPTRNLIAGFPGLNDPDLNNPPYSNYLAWIDEQIAGPTNSHRAFWRERSNPAYTNNPANAHLYEAGHDPAYGHQLTYYDGGTAYKADTNDAVAVGRKGNDVTFGNVETKKIVWYHRALTGDDHLRQKTAWALSQIFVVGEEGSNQENYAERWLTYYDIFVRHAFGNFRDILGEVTFSPHMARYLTYENNQKADPEAGTFPDENYAREVMQLFTIGLWELNQDGTHRLDSNGDSIPAYGNDDITEFAKVFTGMRKPTNRENIEVNYIDSVRLQPSWHDFTPKILLDGSTLGPFVENADGMVEDINGLLDHLFSHSNTPPFIARLLIQRFTVSNPSPRYIHDVAGTFIDNGSGVRGDLGAVVKAILLHPEAREPALAYDPAHGRLREPLIRLMSYARAFEITSPQTYGFFPFYNLDEVFAQSPYDYPTVFSFYLPDYQPLGEVLERDLYAPEFQIHNDITALSLPNAIWWLVFEGITRDSEVGIGQRWYSQGDLDLSFETTLAADTEVLLDHMNLMITAGRLTADNRAVIAGVIDAMPAGSDGEREARVRRALWLFGLLPEFNVIY
jgi:uncharacterized protein (DUF1800 family)